MPELKPRDFGDWLPKIKFAFFSISGLTQASTSGIFSSVSELNPRPALGTEALFAGRVLALNASADSRLMPLDKQANATALLPVPPSTKPLGAALLEGMKRQTSALRRGPFADTRCTTAASNQAREKPVFMRVMAREKNEKKVN